MTQADATMRWLTDIPRHSTLLHYKTAGVRLMVNGAASVSFRTGVSLRLPKK
jgi:hypothetical protein